MIQFFLIFSFAANHIMGVQWAVPYSGSEEGITKTRMSEFSECCDSLEVYHNGPLEFTNSSIYGYYVKQKSLSYGVPWFKNGGKSIWWDWDGQRWNLGLTTEFYGRLVYPGYISLAYLENDGVGCLPRIDPQIWYLLDGSNHTYAGNKVKVRCGNKPIGMSGINSTIISMSKERKISFVWHNH